MIEGMEHIATEANVMQVAQALVKLPTEQIEAAIAWRQASDRIVSTAMPESARLVSQKSTATLQIVLFAIGELRKTLPSEAEMVTGAKDMIEQMEALFGNAKP